MLRLRFSAASKDDLKEIAGFITKDKPIAARQWVEKIREKCRLVANYPEIGDDRATGKGCHHRKKFHCSTESVGMT